MKYLIFLAAAFASQSAFSALPCIVKSDRASITNSEVNVRTICENVELELKNSRLLNEAASGLEITEKSFDQYSLALEIKIKSNKPLRNKQLAVLSWYPGGDVYVQVVEVLPELKMAPPETRSGTEDPRRP